MFILISAMSLFGCASPERQNSYYLPSPDRLNRAPGAAYSADGMVVNKPLPRRPKQDSIRFYFKDCEQDEGRVFYSKTSYNCNAF